MLFNSLNFLLFFPLVYIIYWGIGSKRLKCQNIFLLVASYVFYCFWDYRFGFLLAFSTFLCYYGGLKIEESKNNKKIWLWISICLNLAFLGFFKYYNFFIDSFSELLLSMGFKPHLSTLSIILPVGISFYTFHGLSYVIDIYYGKIQPTRNVINYSLFVAFFPLLVAGPIERATHLLPQINNPRRFDYKRSVDGLRQILWGFFKKMVVADNCATYVNDIFSNYETLPASTLLIGAILFAFQIYCDFSGYSDIALGCARLLGIELIRNFNYPYFARDIAEFWRKWHISLTTWFRDYIYIPLGGSRVSKIKVIRNTFVIFLVSGFWHGANWTFILWGFLHAMFFLPLLLKKKNRKYLDTVAKGKYLPTLREFISIMSTFGLVVFAWIIFRAENITQAFHYIKNIFSTSILSVPKDTCLKVVLLPILFMLLVEWIQREKQHGLADLKLNTFCRYILYYTIAVSIIFFSASQESFIYFQF